MRRVLAVALLVLGCEPPAIADGVFACATDLECPAAAPRCVLRRCQRASYDAGPLLEDAGDGSSCGIACGDLQFVCNASTARCEHPCTLAPEDCPVETMCRSASGCVRPDTCGADCEGICERGACRTRCAMGDCPAGLGCAGELCLPLLDRAVHILEASHLEGASCPAGRNPDFVEGTLEGWCWHWSSATTVVPMPSITLPRPPALRAVILGRPARPPDASTLATFTLLQIYSVAEVIDQHVQWDYVLLDGGDGAGVALGFVFFGRDPPVSSVQSFHDGSSPPTRVLDRPHADHEATGPLNSDPTPVSVRDRLLAAAPTVDDPVAAYPSVAVLLMVSSTAPRAELHHVALRWVAPTDP